MTQMNGLTIQQLLFENMGVCQIIHGWQNMGGQTIIRSRAQPHVRLQNLLHCGAVASVREL
eukprot:844749-Pelagomonas_calceolata.AAC.1